MTTDKPDVAALTKDAHHALREWADERNRYVDPLLEEHISAAIRRALRAVEVRMRETSAALIATRAGLIKLANEDADEQTPNWQWLVAVLQGEVDSIRALPLETEKP